MSAESDRLPFEPNKKRQKPAKAESKPPIVKQESVKKERKSHVIAKKKLQSLR